MERIASRAGVLLDGIITFWKGLRDDAFGGYYGYMSQGLELDKTAEKGCILNSRILWFFSEAAMLTGWQALREETVTCTSTMPPATPGSIWPPPPWRNCWITPSIPRQTPCAAGTAWPSGAGSLIGISNI